MSSKQEKINILPRLTWRFLGVNYDTVELTEYESSDVHVEVSDKTRIKPTTKADVEKYEAHFRTIQNGITLDWLDHHMTSLTGGYAVESVPEDEPPVELTFSCTEGLLADHHLLYAKENETLNVVIRYENPVTNHSGVTRIVAEKGATVNLYKIHHAPDTAVGVDVVTANVKEDATVNIISVEMGGKHMITNYQLELQEKNAKGTIESVYLGKNDEVLDIAYRINHYGENTRSDILTNGVLSDTSKKTFKGTLDFLKGAKGAKGNELETVALLDKTVQSRAVPILLCTEHDVEGNHAAVAGKLEDDLLFYLMSRGFSKKEATSMLITARVMPTLEKLPSSELQDEIIAYLEESIATKK